MSIKPIKVLPRPTPSQRRHAVPAGDFEELVEAVFLILIQDFVNARFAFELFLIADLLPAKEFMQSTRVYKKRWIVARMPFDDAQNLWPKRLQHFPNAPRTTLARR